jgi:predicted nucleic acid-binding protein
MWGLRKFAEELRAKYGVRTPDALQLAAAVQAGATGFITNDRRLEAIKELEIGVLDDFLG